MTTLYNCSLNGVPLAGVDDRICILDIREDAPKLRSAASPLPDGGRRVTQTRESLTVRITIAIQDETPIQRKKAMQAVHAWAMAGGVLTISDRPGQQLTVECSQLPDISCADWTESLTIAFTTTHCPFWEDESATSVTGYSSLTFTLPGTAEMAPVDAVITNTGTADATRVSIQCGPSYIIFEDIVLPAGAKLYLKTVNGVLSAIIYGESVLACRTAGSSDLLLAPCGQDCIVCAMALQPLEATFSARGRYV